MRPGSAGAAVRAVRAAHGAVRSATNRLESTQKLFFSDVDVGTSNGAHTILLDGKAMRTPLGHTLAVPAHKAQLAQLVAHEWRLLHTHKAKPTALPLTSLVCRAVDLAAVHCAPVVDAELAAKVGGLAELKQSLLHYLDTDTCLIYTTHSEYDGALRRRQEELYRPLAREYESFFGAWARKHGLNDQVSLQTLDCETEGLCGKSQDAVTRAAVLHWLDALPMFDLVALEKAVLVSKSFLCGATTVRSHAREPLLAQLYQVNHDTDYYRKLVEEIIELGNLETIFQTAEWGEVEDTHDVDKVDWMRNVSACALVCR